MNLKYWSMIILFTPMFGYAWIDLTNPPAAVTLSPGYGTYLYSPTYYPAQNWANNTCIVIVQETQPTDPNTGITWGIEYRSYSPLSDCFGVYVEPIGEGVPEETLRSLLVVAQSRPVAMYSRKYKSYYSTQTGHCNTHVGAIRNYYMSNMYPLGMSVYPGECTVSQPVACTVSAPGAMVHNPTTAGRVNSETHGNVVVQCNRNASVTVSAMQSTIQLRGDSGGNLRSSIHVGTRTGNSTTATADPVVNVDIWSRINDTADTAGTYTGSTVLTVQWD